MNLSKYVLIITLVLVCASFGFAKKYSDAPAGQGTSTVGTTLSDYTSLYEASLDFNSTANTGSWTLEIMTDLSEATSVAFANTLGAGSTVTIKPGTGITATVTFLQAGDNTVSAHLLVGCLLSGYTPSYKMDGFTIDGSNNGTNSQDLTFQNVTGSTGNLSYTRIVSVVGDSDGVVIKNCKFINNTTNGAYINSTIRFGTYAGSVPDNWTVQNCYIVATSSQIGIGIASGTGGTVSAGTAQQGWSIIGNTVHGVRAAIYLTNNANGTIANNTIRVDGPNGMTGGWGINHENSNRAGGWTINIYNNNFDKLQTANIYTSLNPLSVSWGMIGILLQGAYASAGATYNVYNNMIGGFNITSTAVNTTQFNYQAIRITNGYPTTNIFYNTINMPNFGEWAFTPNRCYAIGWYTTGYFNAGGVLNVKNNIVRQMQPNGGIFYSTPTGAPIVSDYNDLVVSGTGPFLALIGVATTSTLADWQTTASQDSNSCSVDPTTTSPGTWVSTTNMHFTGGSAFPLKAGTPISITTDIDGDTRDSSKPWPGCDEVPG
ncbi:MAG: hypothetical protein ACE14V_08805, partial [bacterium]